MDINKFVVSNNSTAIELMELAKKYAYKIIMERAHQLSPRALIGLGHFLFALSKFPTIIDGLYVTFGLRYEEGDHDFFEKVFLQFTISSACFKWSHYVHTYQKEIGSDGMVMSSYNLNADGTVQAENIYNIDDVLAGFYEMGAVLYVEDLSCVDMGSYDDED
jgi:hypothetical protein